MTVNDSVHIGKITYAIDHNTDLLHGGIVFKQVEISSRDTYTYVYLSFDGTDLLAKYITRNHLEVFKLSRGNNGYFNLIFESFAIHPNMNFEQALKPSESKKIVSVVSRFNDLRRVEYELRNMNTRKVTRNVIGKDGQPELVQFKTVTTSAGLSTSLFNELVPAFRSYLRNKANKVLKESVEAEKVQKERTRAYQTVRREAVNQLHESMKSMLSSCGLEPDKMGAPSISVTGVQRYVSTGLGAVSARIGGVEVFAKILASNSLGTVGESKSAYRSAVEAVDGGIKCLDEATAVIIKARPTNSHPASLGRLSRVSDGSGEGKKVHPAFANVG